jgi:hypothetical protein
MSFGTPVKRMRHRTKGARDWFSRFRQTNPHLFAHWILCPGNGRTIGSRVNREVPAQFWERPEVKFLRASRQRPSCSPPDDALRSMCGMPQIPGMLAGRTSAFS